MRATVAPLLPIDDARTVVLDHTRPLAAEDVRVEEALGRVLAEDVVADHHVPPFANSAMDGFLVAAGDAGRTLTIAGESRAGTPATAPPGAGEALRVSTGALVPEGAEAVIPIEQVTEREGRVTTNAATRPGQHIRAAGEDVTSGATVLTRGTRLGAAEIGLAVIAGRATVRCTRRPTVTVLATGDELVPPGEPLGPGQIHDSNALTLAALATEAGGRVLQRVHIPDDEIRTREHLQRALGASDVVVVSGGVSVGPHDHVKPALEALGVTEHFWRVALRPGKPTWFGTRDGTLVFGLPGNPVSAMVTFLLFARPALAALQGADPTQTRITARLTQAVPRNTGRDEAVRVTLTDTDDGRKATPTGPQGSHQLTSMLRADGLALVTQGEGEVAAGEPVTVELLGR
jgi:molybdopterin molybdotransferase